MKGRDNDELSVAIFMKYTPLLRLEVLTFKSIGAIIDL
jgi:hypothetical protein